MADLRLTFIVALVLRLSLIVISGLMAASTEPYYAPDSVTYVEPAASLAGEFRFTTSGEPEIVRTPGYPLLLALGGITGRQTIAVILLQAVLGSLQVLLVARIATILFQKRTIGRLAGFLIAIEPLSILYCARLLTETLFCFCLMTGIWLLAEYFWKTTAWQPDDEKEIVRKSRLSPIALIVLASVVFAIATYVRPVGIYIPLLGGLFLTARAVHGKALEKKPALLHAAVFVFFACGLISIWQVRNYLVSGYYGMSTIPAFSIYFYQGAATLAVKEGKPYYDKQKEMGYLNRAVYLQNHPEQGEWTDAQLARYWHEQGQRIILENPGIYATIHFKGIARGLFDPGTTEYMRMLDLYPVNGGLLGRVVDKGLIEALIDTFRQRPGLVVSLVAGGLVLGLYYLFTLHGLFRFRTLISLHLMLVLIALYFVLLSGGPMTTSRFRQPIMPIVCIFAGSGLAVVAEKLIRRR